MTRRVLALFAASAALGATMLVVAPESASAVTSTWWSGNLGSVSQEYGCTTESLEPLASTMGHTCPSSKPYWHAGVDIDMGCGTDLYAPVPVTIVSIGAGGTVNHGLGPDYPSLRLPDGKQVFLGHSQATTAARDALASRATVPAGTVLAKSNGAAGSGTGASTGCHLHFEVHTSGGYTSHDNIDPSAALNLIDTLPVRPESPRVTSTTGTGAKLSWTDASNNEDSFVSHYRIGTGSWVTGPSVAANSTSMTVSGLARGTSYTFQVGAHNTKGTKWSAYFTGKTVALPAQPTSPDVKSTSGSSAVLTWGDASNNETSFVSQYRVGSGPWVAGPSVGANTTSLTVPGLKPATTYTFQVGAKNVAGTRWSAYFTGKTKEVLPAQPMNPRVTSTTGTSAVLAWTDASNNESTFVSQYKVGSGAWVTGPSVGANVTSLTVSWLKVGTKYTFQVGARNSIGTRWSAYFYGTTDSLPAQPMNLRVTSKTGTSAVLAWTDASNNESTFVSQYKIGSGAWVTGPTVAANTTSLTVNGLKIGTKYTFQVGARNSKGTHWSAYAYGTTAGIAGAEGAVVRAGDTGRAYFIDAASVRHWIPNGGVYLCLTAWNGVRVIEGTQAQADAFAEGSTESCQVTQTFNTIVRVGATGTSYYIDGAGVRHWIPNGGVYSCLYYWNGVPLYDNMSQAQADAFAEGSTESCQVTQAFNTVIRESTTGTAYFVDGGGVRHWIQDGASYNCLVKRYPLYHDLTWDQVRTFAEGSWQPKSSC